MLTINQIKAARALIGWTQEDLARKSGMSLAAINKLEREITSPRQFTLDIIRQTLEREGVEFTDGPGVRLTETLFKMRVLDGEKALKDLLDDVFYTLKDAPEPREALHAGMDESRWTDFRELVDHHQARLKAHNIFPRALICEGDTNFLPHLDPQRNYRWIPKALFTQMPYYVYGDKYAMILWGPPMRIIIIENKIIAETFRRQFEINWANGRVPEV